MKHKYNIMGLVSRDAGPVGLPPGDLAAGAQDGSPGEPDDSPSLPSQGSPGPTSSLPTSTPPQPVPFLQLGGAYPREAPLERVKEWGIIWPYL